MNDARARSWPPWPLLAIALVGIAGHALLLAGLPLYPAVLPLGIAGALLWARPRPAARLPWPVLAVVAVAAVAIAFGSVATEDRSWDGRATWTLTARHLAAGAGLDAPYFAHPEVYHAARGYPLLQPILLQQCMSWAGELGGRLLFPLLWLAFVAGVFASLRWRATPRAAAVCTLAAAVVPLFVDPGGGSAESGFADLLLALLLVFGAQALLGDARTAAFLVALSLPLAKNEGAVHAAMLAGAAALAGRDHVARAAALGGTVALLVWLPVQERLLQPGAAPGLPPRLLLAGLPLVAAGLGAAVRAGGWRRGRSVALIAALACAVLVAAAPECARWFGLAVGPLQVSSLPSVAMALAAKLFWVRKLGLTFPALIVAAIVVHRRRRELMAGSPAALGLALAAFVAAHIGFVAVFVATRPAEQTGLMLQEGLVRYLAQVTGVAWIAIGLLTARRSAEPGAGLPAGGSAME